MREPIDDLRVVRDEASSRYLAHVGDQLAGYAMYEAGPDRVVLTHTVVLPTFRGQGVGSRLAAGALDDLRTTRLAVVPTCSFIADFIHRHPVYADLLAPDTG